MANTNKNYLNQIFIKKTWSDPKDAGNLLLSVGIKKEEFIKEIEALPVNENGFINTTIGRQKTNENKFSMWVDDYVSTRQPAADVNNPTNKPQNDNSELPF